MVRIISGVCRGRRLKTLKGRAVRPTSDRAKETLFDILNPRIKGSRFLDLFSGSGSIGLEAASRGSATVVMVESDPGALNILQQNINACGFEENIRIYKTESGKTLQSLISEEERFDLVFLDPPYRDHEAYELIRDIGNGGLLKQKGLVIAEHDRHHELPDAYGDLMRVRTKQVGDTIFSFYGGDSDG